MGRFVKPVQYRGYSAHAPLTTPPAPAVNKIPGAPEPPDNRVRGAGGQFRTPPDTSDFAAFEKMAGAG
jgi:hypothetical protein